ncbi:MAG: proline--tRNA ligase [Deltaproteobacteria bacterium]|nr:proline--tRNA ligase [Deltaproteobacteria bacterium]
MKYSKSLIPTLREDPADAECVSHKLMLRAGLIRQVTRGSYDYLPLGLRVIRKVEKIVREEMDAAGCQEVLLPIVIPAELWQESGRWERYGKELLRVKDRSNRDFCIGPTHEEVITDLVRREIKSYRDLPKNLYQINTKYRDEVRPRFGLMRGREFIMKDGYSFHTSVEDLDRHYEVMKNAYLKIFQRCGLDARAVEADTGSIGGYSSHELVVLADTGESIIATCGKCDYTASAEIAASARPSAKKSKASSTVKEVHTPSLKTVEEVASYLKVEPSQMIKTLIYLTDKGLIVALIAGNLELNEVKLTNATGAAFLTMADEAAVKKLTGAEVGFAGPVSLPAEVQGIGKVRIIADISIEGISNAVTGANKTDYHLTGVCDARDFKAEKYIDLSSVKKGDVCPKCGKGKLDIVRGIEVGQVFKLGTKYSEALKAVFLDENGKEKPMIMGTYGIGIGRTAAAAIEQNNDENGIIWPLPLAPFHVELISVGEDSKVSETAEKIYAELMKNGIEVLFDDRAGRPGVKFADADLIGIPYQAIIGKKAIEQGKIEFKIRKTGERKMVGAKDIIDLINKELH